MKTLILPGYSPHNREWAKGVKQNLELGHEVVVHEWRHWKDKSLSLSIRFETGKILEEIGSEKVNIIAKSVGTRVVMHLTSLLKNQIEKVILCGIPTRGTSDVSKKIYTEGLKHIKPQKVVCFQNTKDPFASFADIKKFISMINPEIEVVEKPRSDHSYPYFEDFNDILPALKGGVSFKGR